MEWWQSVIMRNLGMGWTGSSNARTMLPRHWKRGMNAWQRSKVQAGTLHMHARVWQGRAACLSSLLHTWGYLGMSPADSLGGDWHEAMQGRIARQAGGTVLLLTFAVKQQPLYPQQLGQQRPVRLQLSLAQ